MMFGVIFIICCLISCWYLPSAGGTGVNLGYNLLLLSGLGLIVVMTSFRRPSHSRANNNQILIFSGAVCVIAPWAMQVTNSPGCIILLLAFLCWLLMQRKHISDTQKQHVVLLIFCLAILQSAIALLQTFCPTLAYWLYEYNWITNHGRPYGIFQQYNLLASFLATGFGCGVLLLLRETRRSVGVVGLAGLTLLSFVLSLIQSRTGELGAVIITLVLVCLYGRTQKRRVTILLALTLAAAASGQWVVEHTHVLMNGKMVLMARAFDDSNYSRWHILSTTMKMIMLKPWLGWGYGTYEYAFSRFWMLHPDPGYQYGVITHPHNELLFAWFQGGIIALLGMVLLFAGWVKNIVVAARNKSATLGYTLLIVPLLVHLNLEYPFYQSFIHLAVFVVLLRLGEEDKPERVKENHRTTRIASVMTGAGMVCYSLVALFAHQQLTRYEREGYAFFPDPMPWYFSAQYERAHYDAMVAVLIDYNRTRNPDDLVEFMRSGQKYSGKHNDKNILSSMIAIAHYQNNDREAYRLEQQFNKLFPRS
ncbi:MAG: Wzy polymerase domain-containing protein [Silvania sp.]